MKRIIIVAGIIGLITLCYKKLFGVAMIVGGFFVAPEASQILSHYCFGDGDTLTTFCVVYQVKNGVMFITDVLNIYVFSGCHYLLIG